MALNTITFDPDIADSMPLPPPFIAIPGVHNLRSLGGYPIEGRPHTVTKQTIFRSASLENLSPESIEDLAALNIKAVFDLRSKPELSRYTAPDFSGTNITRILTPIYKDCRYTGAFVQRGLQAYMDNRFLEMYINALEDGVPAITTIFRYILEHPDDGVLVSCSAGKDRTGVLSAMILTVAGVDKNTIVEDYALSTHGLRPMRPSIEAYLTNMPEYQDLGLEERERAVRGLTGSGKAIMKSFLEDINSHGGVEGYLENKCGLSKEELGRIREALVVQQQEDEYGS